MSRVIVVVENDLTVRTVLVRFLEKMEFSIHAFSNGKDALELLRTGCHVDLIIADPGLPGRLSGLDLVRIFQSLNPAGQALIISSEDWDSDEIPFLRKPFGFAEFEAKVKALFGDD